MKDDGEVLINYLKNVKNCKIIGIHGESLGGTIATHLAKVSNVNFLFADRTFASLSNAARYNFGKFAEILFRAVGPKDSNSVKDFFDVNCFKIISCDCNDMMINNLGSLKAGIAIQYFSLNFNEFPLTAKEISQYSKAMKEIQNSAKFKKNKQRQRKEGSKGHLDHANVLKNLFNNLEEIIIDVDAGGESLLDLLIDCSDYSIKI